MKRDRRQPVYKSAVVQREEEGEEEGASEDEGGHCEVLRGWMIAIKEE